MATRHPGFGPSREPWISFEIGGILIIVGGLIFLLSASRWSLVWGALGLGGIAMGIIERKAQRLEEEALHVAPPIVRDTLTHMILSALFLRQNALVVNRQGQLTPQQQKRIRHNFPSYRMFAGMSSVHAVSGSVKLIKGSRNIDCIKIGGLRINTPHPGVIESLKRTAQYRIYYVNIKYKVGRSGGSYNLMVSAEALGDA